MMASSERELASGLSGRDHYSALYNNQLARQAEWLTRTAGQKVMSIETLLAREGILPTSVLEIGAGTGAVIGLLRERGIGTEHYATDFSEAALSVLNERYPAIHTAVADVTMQADPFGAGPYDVVIASHVIEHLEHPEAFLRALQHVPARWFIAEVPLEDLSLGRLRAHFKDRMNNAAGHVQFFKDASFLTLLEETGWKPTQSFKYAPRLSSETFQFAYKDFPTLRRWQKKLTEQILPSSIEATWTRFYHAHLAVLCRCTGP